MQSIKKYMIEIFNHLPTELQEKAIEEHMFMQLMKLGIVIELRFYKENKSGNRIIVHNRGNKMYMEDISLDDGKAVKLYDGHLQIGNHQILYREGMYFHINCDEFRFLKDAKLEEYERRLI